MLFSTNKFQLVKQSVLLHEGDVSPWSCVKIVEKTVLLFVSNKEGKELNLQDDKEAVQVFTILDDAKFLVHKKKIYLELPVKKYLSIWYFDQDYLVGCRKRETLAEVWSLKDSQENSGDSAEDSSQAPLIWSDDVSHRSLFRCTCVLLHYPDVFIGLSNGRCDIYDIQFNVKRRSLLHQSSPVYDTDYLFVRKVLTTSEHILSLSSDGKLHVWNKEEVLGLGRSETSMSSPLWTVKSTTRGNKILNIFADNTKIVTLEKSLSTNQPALIIYDFWHCKKKFNTFVQSNPPIELKKESRRLKKCKFS